MNNPPTPTAAAREAVARIIDPAAWMVRQALLSLNIEGADNEVRVSLAKAGAILALPPASTVAEERAGWLPIETAPKDGTRILGFGHRGDQVDIIEWASGRYLGKTTGYRQTWVSGPGQEVTPTHWQPLPPAPDASLIQQAEEESKV